MNTARFGILRSSFSILAVFIIISFSLNPVVAKEIGEADDVASSVEISSASTVDGEGKAIPAAIPAIVAGLRVAYLTWQRSRAAVQAARLRDMCTKAYQAYKKLTFTACKDRCGGQFDREKRDRCYEILIPEINNTIDIITAELDARMAVFDWCAKSGVGIREDGTPMLDDKGHWDAIEIRRNAQSNCKEIAKRRSSERANRKGMGDSVSPYGTSQ